MKQSKTATLILTNMKNYKSTRKLAFWVLLKTPCYSKVHINHIHKLRAAHNYLCSESSIMSVRYCLNWVNNNSITWIKNNYSSFSSSFVWI
jgi:hypothetical protein